MNRDNSIHNTNLVMWYCRLEPRVQPLILLVKLWAKRRGVCNSRNSTLSSYAWVLLVLHFLQNSSPPVIQVLPVTPQYTMPPPSDFNEIWHNENVSDLSELLLQFFMFYGDLDSDSLKYIISVRYENNKNSSYNEPNYPKIINEQFELSSKTCHPWRFCIEDPTLPTDNLGRVVHRPEGQQLITNELRRGLEILQGSHEDSYSLLCQQNEDIPDLPLLCNSFHCEGQPPHAKTGCPNARCNICKGKGHSEAECTNVMCHRCRCSSSILAQY